MMITEHKNDSWKLIDERLLWLCRFDLTVGNTLFEEIVASEGDGRFIMASTVDFHKVTVNAKLGLMT